MKMDKNLLRQIAVAIVEMATAGYHAPIHGAWYWDGKDLVYVAPRETPSWGKDDQVISVADLLPEGVYLRWFDATPPAWALEGEDPEKIYQEAFNAAVLNAEMYIESVLSSL